MPLIAISPHQVRRATLAETRRQEALEGLKEAERAECDAKGKSYDFLHGSIVTARARGVNQLRLDRAQVTRSFTASDRV